MLPLFLISLVFGIYNYKNYKFYNNYFHFLYIFILLLYGFATFNACSNIILYFNNLGYTVLPEFLTYKLNFLLNYFTLSKNYYKI